MTTLNTYKTFNDWFHEVENYANRSERFYDEFDTMTPQRAVEWLQASWECARHNGLRDKFDSESG